MHIWPQITFLCLSLVGTGIVLAKYGEKKITTYDWTDFVSTAALFTILYYGGFFAPLGFTP